VIGILGNDSRSKAMGAALLATAANDPALMEVIRDCIAKHTAKITATKVDFVRAAIVTLAIDGLKMREALRVSSFTAKQREQIVKELLRLADEAYDK
jgi:hypothetical protein